jgi:L-gulonate 5-dehydrogenase
MRAVVMRSFGDADVLEVDEVDAPAPGAGEVLVRVGAVEVSRTRDVATRSGTHPFSREVSLPHVLGGDFAGTVEAVGPGGGSALVGRRVAASGVRSCGHCPACRAGMTAECASMNMLGIHRWGSYAELVVVPQANVHVIPDDVSLADAAAMAANGPIAYTQLELAQVGAGTAVAVTGATGALGTVLLALAARLGARPIGLARRPAAIPAGLAAERLDSADPELGARLRDLTAGAGIAAMIDNVAAADVFARCFPALAIGARVVVSGALGTEPLAVPAGPFYLRSISLIGVRTATHREAGLFWAEVDAGFRLPAGLVHERPLEDAASAHTDITAGRALGHTVLVVAP